MNERMTHLLQAVRNLHREESGQDLLEYALVLGTVLAAVVLGSNNIATLITNAMTTLGTQISNLVS